MITSGTSGKNGHLSSSGRVGLNSRTSRKSTMGKNFVGSRYGKNPLSSDQKERCEEMFDMCDIDKSGSIDGDELLSMLLKLNVQIPLNHQKVVVREMLYFLGKEENGEITLQEFFQLWSAYHDWKHEKDMNAPSLPWFPPVKGAHSNKLALFLIFDDPSSCKLAQMTSVFIITTIALSVCTFVMETMPEYREWESGIPGNGIEVAPDSFKAIETFSITLFSIEYLVRFFLVGFTPPLNIHFMIKFKNFVLSPMNIIDLLAIVPYYIELSAATGSDGESSAFGVLRVLRVARVFRIFKLGKYSQGLQMFTKVIVHSVDAMLLLLFFLSIAVVLFGSLVYYAEKGQWNHQLGGFARLDVTGLAYELTPFTSIPAAFWWVVTTTTTVGYGDFYPTSVEGKLIGFVTMLIGILALALPVTIIGTNFSKIYRQLRNETLAIDQKGMVDFFLEQNKTGRVFGDGDALESEVNLENGSGRLNVRVSPASFTTSRDDSDNRHDDSEYHLHHARDQLIKTVGVNAVPRDKAINIVHTRLNDKNHEKNSSNDGILMLLNLMLSKMNHLEEKVNELSLIAKANGIPSPPPNGLDLPTFLRK
jgi:hypothetical protein